MHIRFIYSGGVSLGIEYLSAALKQAGHTTDMVLDLWPIFNISSKGRTSGLREKFLWHILKDKPDLLAFSVTSVNIQWAFLVAEAIKTCSDIPIVFGGIQPTLIPEAVIHKDFIDYVVVGEGEEACVELADGISRGSVDPKCGNLWLKRDKQIIRNAPRRLVCPLDSLPFPDKNINPLFLSNHRCYSIITGRGCLGQCSYCCVPSIRRIYYQKQSVMRRRSPENVIAELVAAKKEYGIQRVFFEDNLFTHDNEWLEQFAPFYKKNVDLPCMLCAHPNFINEETVFYLQEIKCRVVQIGVQSLNPEMREKVLKRFYSNDQVRRSLNLLKSSGISCVTDNIVGLPGEHPDDVLEMVRFYNELRPGRIAVFYLKYYPGSEIMDFADWPLRAIEEFNSGGQYKPVVQSDRLQRNPRLKLINKMLLVLILTYFLPRWIVRSILDKKWYLLFPAFPSGHALNEWSYYFFAFFTRRGRQTFVSMRGLDWLGRFYAIKLWFSLRFRTHDRN